jgi:uncharacterized protein YbjQ (UPF0145 family)
MPESRWTGRIITAVTFLVLLSLLTSALYWVLRHGANAVLSMSPDELSSEERARRMTMVLLAVLLTGVLILVFVIGVYLVLRAGQVVRRTRLGGEATEYRDAWAEARVSEEQLAAADEQLREAQSPPEDGPDRPTG